MVLTTDCLQTPVFSSTTKLHEYSSVILLLSHVLIFSKLNSAPTALPKLPLLHFLLDVSGTGRSKTEFIIFSVKLVSPPVFSKWFKPITLASSFISLASVLLPTSHLFIHQVLSFLAPFPLSPALSVVAEVIAAHPSWSPILSCLLKSLLHTTVGINF